MIRAITLDLDDTLWPIEPVIVRAEQALSDWLHEHCPQVAAAWPVAAMRGLREQIGAENPQLAHDFTALRKRSLQHAFEPYGHPPQAVDRAFEVFFAARNQVELYPEVHAALPRLAARWPLLSLSNGNADLGRVGLAEHFVAAVSAREVGAAKPDPRIFEHAAALLGLPAQRIAHVGDDTELDVLGAKRAGFVAVWLNRDGRRWPHETVPDIVIQRLDQLESELDRLLPASASYGVS